MADYNESNFPNLGHLKKVANKAKAAADKALAQAALGIKSGEIVNNTIKLYTSTNKSGSPAISFNIPEEMFLDQNKTKFVGNFQWSAETYPGSENPQLDGKPVFVLAVKGDTTTTYSFLDMQTLVDTYTAGDGSVTVSGYTIKVAISAEANNILELKADGLYVPKPGTVDISGKADKVESATNGHLAGLDANGNLTDSGIAASEVLKGTAATDAEVEAMLKEVFGEDE